MIQAAKIIRTGLAITGFIGACVGIGVVFGALIIGVSRNPSLRGQLFSYAILRFAFSEVTGLFASMMAFLSRNVSIGIRLAANILSGHMLPGNPHNFNSFRKVSAAVSGLSSAIIPYLGYTIVVMLYSRGININATNIDLELLGLVNPTQTQMGSVIDSISNNITIIISLFPIMSVAMGITGGINILLGLNYDLMVNLLHMALLDLTTYLELTLANLERVFASDDSGFYAQRLYQIRRDAYLLRFVYHGLLFFASFRGSGLGTLEIGGFAITRITDRVNQLLSDLGIE